MPVFLGLFSLAPTTSRAADASLYDCTIVSQAVMTPAGLEVTPYASGGAARFTFDGETGMFRRRYASSPDQLEIIQAGDPEKGFDLIANWGGGQTSLRIRVWEEGMPFVWDDAGYLYSGTCKPWWEGE